MKRKSTLAAIGGYQPFLFCIGMYFVALFFSIFICSAIFNAVNPKSQLANKSGSATESTVTVDPPKQVLLTVSNK